VTSSSGRSGAALLLLRAFVGVAFLFHGTGKLPHLTEFARAFGLPVPLAAAAAWAQIAGGVLLIAGALTPLAAVAIGSTMAVAVAKLLLRGEPFIRPDGHTWESAAFYLVSCVALLLLGPGPWSVDARLRASRRAERAGVPGS